MPNDAFTQQRLAQDLTFQGRVRGAMSRVAFEVMEEDPTTPNHDARANYARQVISNMTYIPAQVSPWLAERPNLVAAITSYDFPSGAIVTSATDADIESQLHTDWDHLSGL
jgi:hypothetical protein